MADDLDPKLLRAFAQAGSTPAAEPFVSQVTPQLQPGRRLQLGTAGIYAVLGGVLGSLANGILMPLRLRQTRLLTLGAAVMTIWAAFF
jgi:hypothetical protein